jgi:DNA polymerase-3 subunit epsilon
MHPGQRNGLDALCKRYSIDNAHRTLHGALLDARILADVYLAMTGGQSALALDEAVRAGGAGQAGAAVQLAAAGLPMQVIAATPDELAAHEQFMQKVHKSSGGKSLWQ